MPQKLRGTVVYMAKVGYIYKTGLTGLKLVTCGSVHREKGVLRVINLIFRSIFPAPPSYAPYHVPSIYIS